MKEYLLLFIIFLLLFVPVNINALVEKSDRVYVTDEGDLLTDDSEDYIVKYSHFLYKSKKIDFYVVTVKNIEGETLEDYTTAVFEEFNISNQGIIILVSKDDKQLRVQVGQKLLKIIDHDLIDEYIKTYFMPYLKNAEWNDGIINGYSAFYKYICEEYGIDATTMEVVDHFDFLTKYKTAIMMVIVWLIVLFAKIYEYFQKKIKKSEQKKLSDVDLFILVLSILANIFVVSVSYVLKPIFIVFVIILEVFFLYSSLSSTKKDPSKKTRIHRPKVKQKKIKRIKKYR